MKNEIDQMDKISRVKKEMGLVEKENKYLGASYTKPPADDIDAPSAPPDIDPQDF